ncbi:MAG: response regulator transcription factor [Campylobacterales bacterium]|nr:response regulator transcription factor [Campylobacterales bacterium]
MHNDVKEYDILFVEDEKAIRANYVKYLQRYFKNVYEAEDGERAYEIYKAKKPHIMIIDINLPKLNGIDLLKKIREKDHSTKVLMLTSHTDTGYLLDAASLQLTKYLVKPISREDLKNALNLVEEELSKFTITEKKRLTLKDNFSWDYDSNELYDDNYLVLLTNKERKILTILFSDINRTFTYDDIIIDVWYDLDEDKVAALKTIIKNIRKKVPENTIKNVFGEGYKIEI